MNAQWYRFLRFLLLLASFGLSSCIVSDVLDGGPWCTAASHVVVPGEGSARSEPCWREGVVCNLRNAIHSVNLCDNRQTLELRGNAEYLFDKADSTWSQTSNPEKRIVDRIKKRLIIEGNSATLRIATSTTDLWYFEVIRDASLEIRDLTILGSNRGTCPARGGASGIVNLGKTTLRGVVMNGHDTCTAGGVILSTGELYIESSSFKNNRSSGGASVIVQVGPDPELRPITSEKLEVFSSSFEENVADGERDSAAVIACGGVRCIVTGSTFFNNTNTRATIFGGPCCAGADANITLRKSTLTNNRNDHTGGINMEAGQLTIEDSTITDNLGSVAAGLSGFGGLDVTNTAFSTPDSTPICTSGPFEFGTVLAFGMANDSSCSGLRVVPDLLLHPAALNGGSTLTRLPRANRLRQASSPLIDAGTACAPTDQRGVPRPQGAACDIGSVEARWLHSID